MRPAPFHLAASVDSEDALCGDSRGDCILIDRIEKHRDLVFCAGCLKVAVAVDNLLAKIEGADEPPNLGGKTIHPGMPWTGWLTNTDTTNTTHPPWPSP